MTTEGGRTESDPLLVFRVGKSSSKSGVMLSLIAAGICLLPAGVVMVVTLPVLVVLLIPGLSLLCYSKPKAKSSSKVVRKRAIITGGSSGIGLSVAEECLCLVDEIVLLARTARKLERAKERLEELAAERKLQVKIKIFSMDVSKPEQIQKTTNQIFDVDTADKEDTTATFLFCIAGTTYPEYFENVPTQTIEQICHTNQLGTMYTVQAILPKITQGAIVLCSSMAGQVGTFGYCAYSPTKFALRGFAEALYMECCHRPISISLAFPPDTDTPGFALENKTKPPETALMSEAAGLAQPQHIASILVQEVILKTNPNFNVYFNFDGWMLASLTAGFGPVTSTKEAVSQVAGMCLFRIVSLFYLKSWIHAFRQYASTHARGKTNSDKNKNNTKPDKQGNADKTIIIPQDKQGDKPFPFLNQEDAKDTDHIQIEITSKVSSISM